MCYPMLACNQQLFHRVEVVFIVVGYMDSPNQVILRRDVILHKIDACLVTADVRTLNAFNGLVSSLSARPVMQLLAS